MWTHPGFKRENFEPFWLVPKTVDAQPQWLDMYKAYKNDGLEGKVVMLRKMFVEFAENTMQNYNRNTFSTTNGKKGGQLINLTYTDTTKPLPQS